VGRIPPDFGCVGVHVWVAFSVRHCVRHGDLEGETTWATRSLSSGSARMASITRLGRTRATGAGARENVTAPNTGGRMTRHRKGPPMTDPLKPCAVWVVEKYNAWEGYEVVDVFATEERAQRFIDNAKHKGKRGYLRVVRWKVRGGSK
jgi:hypothetical protein